MNKWIGVGRLTKDPDVRYSNGQSGQLAIARFTLAIDRRKSKNNENPGADFISCVAFGHSAEFAEKYIRKGTKMIVEGRIQTGSYDKQDGSGKVYTTEIMVESLEFAESKSVAAQNSGQQDGQTARPANVSAASGFGNSGFGNSRPSPTSGLDEGFMNIPESADDESLPFH